MTFEYLKQEAFRMVGSLSYLNPATDTSYDGQPWLNWVVNEALRQICNWSDPETGVRYRFPFLKSSLMFKSVYFEEDLTDDGTSTTIVLPTSFDTSNDRYNKWIVECNGESHIIFDYDGLTRTATIAGEWTTTPASGDEVKVYKRFSYLAPSTFDWAEDHILIPNNTNAILSDGNFAEVLKIIDITNQRELKLASNAEAFVNTMKTAGLPTKWYRFGNQIIFDYAPDDEIWYELEYYRTPTQLVNDDDVPELPENFHFGIILWCRYWGFMRQQDFTAAYSAKKDITDFMRASITMTDVSKERQDLSGKLQLR